MSNAALGQGISGGAQGAALGFQMGGVPGAFIGGGIGFISGLKSGRSADKQFRVQQQWQAYNNELAYNTSIYNIEAELGLAGLNASMSTLAARLNMQQIQSATDYNVANIYATTLYDRDLMNEQIDSLWVASGLDLEQLNFARGRELGAIISDQGASGTLIGEGSNEDAIVGQMAQHALDANIIKYNAQSRVNEIENAKVQGLWNGEVAIQQAIFQGEQEKFSVATNAAIQNFSTLATAGVRAAAGRYSADQARASGNSTIEINAGMNNLQNQAALTEGLFAAGSTAAAGYYANKKYNVTDKPTISSRYNPSIPRPITTGINTSLLSNSNSLTVSGNSLISGN